MEVYFPAHYVAQADLEASDGAPAGKYTAGLGQRALAFCEDAEDAASMALSALDALLARTGVDPASIGWLSVGTESAPDRSKSVKTTLMRLFRGTAGDVGGVDAVNACYGGTAALLGAAAWVESSAWDGRLAAVVATDIAAYAPGPARPSGGCGAVALLVGPGAPLVLEPALAATHARDAWDFYKPAVDPFPRVDAPLSVACYLECLDACYAGLARRAARRRAAGTGVCGDGGAGPTGAVPAPPRWPAPPAPAFSLASDAAYLVLHAPYGKLLRKAFARLVATDGARAAVAREGRGPDSAPPGPPPDFNEKAAVSATASVFEATVAPGAWLAAETGNMYTASVWAGLAALVERVGAAGLDGQRILLFSYGSGAIATLLSIKCHARDGAASFNLAALASGLRLAPRLAARRRRSPADLAAALAAAAIHHAGPGPGGWSPSPAGIASVRPGDWYLAGVDAEARRSYARKEGERDGGGGGEVEEGGAAVPAPSLPQVQPLAGETAPSTGDLEALIRVG